jgi:hypothetical protein
MAKKKNKLKKALKTLIPLLGIGAVMAGRGRKNLIPGSNTMDDIVPTPINMDDIISIEGGRPIQPGEITGSGFGAFSAAKGGRAGYGKGGKVSRGCGKVMAGRNKKTKYI